MAGITLIAGLGNPGEKYANTRHNVGAVFVARMCLDFGITLKLEKRFNAAVGSFALGEKQIRVLLSATFMNESGRALAPFAKFYRIKAPQILIAHDELDLPPGNVRLKQGGGLSGHNGLRDIVSRLGSDEFARLRIGIGHPPASKDVSKYVLQKPARAQQELIDTSIQRALGVVAAVIKGEMQDAMCQLHSENIKQN